MGEFKDEQDGARVSPGQETAHQQLHDNLGETTLFRIRTSAHEHMVN